MAEKEVVLFPSFKRASWPKRCACCGEDGATKRVKLSAEKNINGSQRWAMTYAPYCPECHRHHRSEYLGTKALFYPGLFISAALGCYVAYIAHTNSMDSAAVLGLLVGVVTMVLFLILQHFLAKKIGRAFKDKLKPTCAGLSAVELDLDANGEAVFLFGNVQYAREFRSLNGLST
jgi:hypothetical protein